MHQLFHAFSNRAAALLMKLLFNCVARLRVLHVENADRAGGFLLASNRISHFDPFILSSIVRRKIDWMTMAEFFANPMVGHALRAVDAFPADRDREIALPFGTRSNVCVPDTSSGSSLRPEFGTARIHAGRRRRPTGSGGPGGYRRRSGCSVRHRWE